MGIKITKETLQKIYKDYEENKNKIKKNKNIPKNKNNINDILKKNFINNNNKKDNIIILEAKNTPEGNENNNNENEIILDKQINDILFRRNSSFELKSQLDFKEEFKLNEIENNENASMIDNISENSDYIDISNEPIFYKIKNNNNEKKVKSIKLRNSYYTKLINYKLLTFEKEKKVTNLFFFDWDDTLMCTSYLAPTGMLDEEESKQIDKTVIKNLDQYASTLLSKSIENGQVFIITNAAHGWIEYSAKKLYPLTSNLLKQIKIVSARGLYEKRLPGDYRQWKSKAFIDTVINCNIDLRKTANILCFGDSIIELEASHKLKEIFADAYIKTIKFKETPQPVELIKELKIILSQFDVILSNTRNLSIRVAKKKTE